MSKYTRSDNTNILHTSAAVVLKTVKNKLIKIIPATAKQQSPLITQNTSKVVQVSFSKKKTKKHTSTEALSSFHEALAPQTQH